MTSQQFSKELEHIARPLVEAGIYASEEAFVRDILKNMALQKVRVYERTVNRFRSKYGSLRGPRDQNQGNRLHRPRRMRGWNGRQRKTC